MWTVAYPSEEAHLPDSKGLRDLAVLLARPGRAVHAVELHTGHPPRTGADAVLDDTAKAAYRNRLAELEVHIDEAEAEHVRTGQTRPTPSVMPSSPSWPPLRGWAAATGAPR